MVQKIFIVLVLITAFCIVLGAMLIQRMNNLENKLQTMDKTVIHKHYSIVYPPVKPEYPTDPEPSTAPETEPPTTTPPDTTEEVHSMPEPTNYAQILWDKLSAEYSPVHAAAILGNIMVECGGHSLNIQPNLVAKFGDNTYYGICQWSKKYFPEIQNTSFEEQLEFLLDTIEPIMNLTNTNIFENFLKETSIQQATLMFAEYYERCDPKYYPPRLTCAEQAYNTFTKK